MEGLSNQMQALLMFFAFLLPPIIAWAALGMPTDKASIGIMIAGMLSGIVAGIKELLGGKPPEKPQS